MEIKACLRNTVQVLLWCGNIGLKRSNWAWRLLSYGFENTASYIFINLNVLSVGCQWLWKVNFPFGCCKQNYILQQSNLTRVGFNFFKEPIIENNLGWSVIQLNENSSSSITLIINYSYHSFSLEKVKTDVVILEFFLWTLLNNKN